MNELAFNSFIQIESHQKALNWALENLPYEKYEKISASYYKLLKSIIKFVLIVCVPIVLLSVLLILVRPISSSIEKQKMPSEATSFFIARVDTDGNFFWTHDSQAFEMSLEEVGLNSSEYQYLDKVKVYIDDDRNIIEVRDIDKGISLENIEILIGILGSIMVPTILIVAVYMPWVRKNVGHEWAEFYKDFQN